MMFLGPCVVADPDPVTTTFVPVGAAKRAGVFRPVRAEMGPTPIAGSAPKLAAPLYGRMTFGARTVAFALSGLARTDGVATLVVDANGNGDLTDDAPIPFVANRGTNPRTHYLETTLDLGKGRPVSVRMYHLDSTAPEWVGDRKTLFYYTDYGYDLGFRLDGKPFSVFVKGDLEPGTSFGIDRDGDGKATSPRETVEIGRPFNFTGTTYRLVPVGDGLSLETVTPGIPLTPPPPNLAVGRPALPIRATALDGRPVDLMEDYRGKIVLLDFWATWCGPCLAELPNVRAAYTKYHAQGFDVLGVSFDEAGFAAKLRAFTKAKAMPWRHVYEGKGWKTTVGTDYDVSGIPFTLLVDGDTGLILADEKNLRGPGLSDFIGKKLSEKKVK